MMVIVVGLGYVGLPLALRFAECGENVTGLDIDEEKVRAISEGRSLIKHIPGERVAAAVATGKLKATTDFGAVKDAAVVIICVPTPLNKNREPDLSYVLNTGKSIGPHLTRGVLVVLESTTYPGTTDQDLRIVLEAASGMTAGRDFHLAYSPEREDPGNPTSGLAQIPKLVGGYTPACLEKAAALYARVVKSVVTVSSCRVAEAAKLTENIFRSVNIALANELKMVFEVMGIDVWEVIEAAKTKPFGYMAFYPGPGLGGHCIPIDPFYLTWKAREFNQNTRFIELSGQINTRMPQYVFGKATEALNSHSKPMRGSKVLVLGLAYKADVDDVRESPAFAIMDLCKAGGAKVDYYDPHVPVVPKTREHGEWAGMNSVAWNKETVGSFDCVILVTAHNAVSYQDLAAWSSCIVDTRNAMSRIASRPGTVWKA